MSQDITILRQIFDAANRANPYLLWAKLRQTPVCWQEDGPDEAGTHVVSTYREIEALLHDPRISSDLRNYVQNGGRPRTTTDPYKFISLDPPEHDRLRRLAMRHFGPPERPEYLEQLRPEMVRIVTTLLDQMRGQRQIDFVESFAYPLPVTVICRILGVPREDEPQFHVWAEAIVESLAGQSDEQRRQREQAWRDLNQYMAGLVERRRELPGDDLLSRMATDTGPEGRMADPYLVATAALLLVAGHETTVNLLGNGMLTLLRLWSAAGARGGPDRLAGTCAAVRAASPGRGPPTLPSQSLLARPGASADRSRWGARKRGASRRRQLKYLNNRKRTRGKRG